MSAAPKTGPGAEKPSVLIFVPAYGGQVSVPTFNSVLEIAGVLASHGIASAVSAHGMPDIAELRNVATTMWFDASPFTHMLHIDSDMGIPPALVLDMLGFGEPVVGALYPKKDMALSWAASGYGEGAGMRGPFMEVEGVGAGCLLIRRDAVARMIEAEPSLADTRIDAFAGPFKPAGVKRLLRLFDKIDLPERGIAAEDLSFCLRWGAAGGTVWAATHHAIAHVGPYSFTACYARDGGKERIPT